MFFVHKPNARYLAFIPRGFVGAQQADKSSRSLTKRISSIKSLINFINVKTHHSIAFIKESFRTNS